MFGLLCRRYGLNDLCCQMWVLPSVCSFIDFSSGSSGKQVFSTLHVESVSSSVFGYKVQSGREAKPLELERFRRTFTAASSDEVEMILLLLQEETAHNTHPHCERKA